MTKKEISVKVKDNLALYDLLNEVETDIINLYMINQINNYSVKMGRSCYVYKKMFKVGDGKYSLWIIADPFHGGDAEIKLKSKYIYERKISIFLVFLIYLCIFYFGFYELYKRYEIDFFSGIAYFIFTCMLLYFVKAHYTALKEYKRYEDDLLKGIENIIKAKESTN